jgi:hypothetical protein
MLNSCRCARTRTLRLHPQRWSSLLRRFPCHHCCQRQLPRPPYLPVQQYSWSMETSIYISDTYRWWCNWWNHWNLCLPPDRRTWVSSWNLGLPALPSSRHRYCRRAQFQVPSRKQEGGCWWEAHRASSWLQVYSLDWQRWGEDDMVEIADVSLAWFCFGYENVSLFRRRFPWY